MPQPIPEDYLETKETIDRFPITPTEDAVRNAVFVMVQNEPVYLPIWLRYYSRYFDGDSIFVFDHRSDDGSLEECTQAFRFNHIRLNYPYSFDHVWFQFVANRVQKRLLGHFDYVLFTDVDEIIIPDPERFTDLKTYLDALDADFVRCKGYELIHLKNREPPFDRSQTVLSQRSYWHPNPFFSKTPLARIPLNWEVGNHHAAVENIPPAKDLMLIHLHKLDFEYCRQRSLQRAKLRWKQEEIESNRGWQNRITHYRTFIKYYYRLPRWYFLPRWLLIRKIPAGLKTKDAF